MSPANIFIVVKFVRIINTILTTKPLFIGSLNCVFKKNVSRNTYRRITFFLFLMFGMIIVISSLIKGHFWFLNDSEAYK